jgi:8-oxo-dGTP pyrophosphatase MutT (NUDIX family)
MTTALREAEEEIGLASSEVEVIGALPPVGTFVTNYKVHPFVGLIGDELRFRPNPTEVETVLAFTVEELRGGFAMRRLVRHGLPIRTPTYLVRDHLIWGATARILGELLERLEPA